MLDRLRRHTSEVGASVIDSDEHKAVVELLVLAMLIDHRVAASELDALERFDDTHPDWDHDDFSVSQYFGPATTKVRSELAGSSASELTAVIAQRVKDTELRRRALAACIDMVNRDGLTPEEKEFLGTVQAALS